MRRWDENSVSSRKMLYYLGRPYEKGEKEPGGHWKMGWQRGWRGRTPKCSATERGLLSILWGRNWGFEKL